MERTRTVRQHTAPAPFADLRRPPLLSREAKSFSIEKTDRSRRLGRARERTRRALRAEGSGLGGEKERKTNPFARGFFVRERSPRLSGSRDVRGYAPREHVCTEGRRPRTAGASVFAKALPSFQKKRALSRGLSRDFSPKDRTWRRLGVSANCAGARRSARRAPAR